MKYYVYVVYEDDYNLGRKYIGVRKTPKGKSPYNDKYMGSFSKKENFCPNKKVVLETFENFWDACEREKELHEKYQVSTNNRFVNRSQQKSRFFHPDAKRKGL